MVGYDRMIDADDAYYVKICEQLNIPDTYGSKENFIQQYAFDKQNLYSIWASVERAYDNAMVMRDEISSNTLSYIHMIQGRMSYQPGITNVHTNAEEAFVLGQGVCQDYAHIYLSLLRLDGIAARYVVGMMMGEGASHAWVEVNCKGYWYGFDPTNDLLVNEGYIKISHGRDYADCIVNRGIFRGKAQQEQKIAVSVKEAARF